MEEDKPKSEQPNNPLHGVKLADILNTLVDDNGWEYLATRVNINCFKIEPSINSSLKFLRKTPWAREKVENLYVQLEERKMKKAKRNEERFKTE